MTSPRICIVGGGLAGLSASYHLVKQGIKDIVVLEATERPGGLLKSEQVTGFTFDTGGSHILFSRDKSVLQEMLSLLDGNYFTHRRNTKIYYKGQFVKYPFENGLKDLPPEERYECLRDMISNYIKRVKGELSPPKNFYEWIRYVFGDAIAEKYLIPYNLKIWKTDLRKITLDWVGGRVPNPPIDDVIKAAVGLDVEGYKHQLIFHYPKYGGIQALSDGLVRTLRHSGVRIETNSRVHKITRDGTKLVVEYGNSKVKCDLVIYTAPLSRSGKILKPILGNSADELSDLRTIPVAVVGIGVRGKGVPYHWIYFPDKNFMFHRVAVISNFSHHNAPPESAAIIAEVSFRSESEMDSIDDGNLISDVIQGLSDAGIIEKKDVVVSKVWRWRDAYVLYDETRSRVLSEVIPALESEMIYPHGRFGSWEYLNMDMVYAKSAALVNRIISKIRDFS